VVEVTVKLAKVRMVVVEQVTLQIQLDQVDQVTFQVQARVKEILVVRVKAAVFVLVVEEVREPQVMMAHQVMVMAELVQSQL
jgi:hypothetical protein